MPDEPRPAVGPSSPDRRKVLVALGFGAANALVLSRIAARPHPTVTNVRERPASANPRAPKQPPALDGAAPAPAADHVFDRVITGGRVIDPQTGFDAIANVGIDGGTITAITTATITGKASVDATNRVVAPGFIDMISYEPNPYGIWFKVADGVTTNLGMHGMLVTAESFFAQYAGKSPCHYGGAYDNYFMRGDGLLHIAAGDPATGAQIDQLAADMEQQVHQGWIGACFAPEYSPGITDDEIARQAAIAAKYGLPCFYHGRYSTDVPPDDNTKTLDEILTVARQTGCASHVMHITSTGGTFQMSQAISILAEARDGEHLDITACLYPYTYWATFLQSPRFADGWQDRFHIDYADLVVPGTGERLNKSTFNHYRTAGTNLLVAAYAIPEQDIVTGLESSLTMIGSDAILEEGNNNHPRAAGCFSRTLGHYVRDQQTLSLVDALAKMTIKPAQRLEGAAPALRKKGRLQRGADADITIFDPAAVADRATIDQPAQEAGGIDWVLVLGQPVKTPDGLQRDVLPGQPIMSSL